MEKTVKYFINLQKAYEKNGKVIVQGIASGTLEDRDGEKVNIKVLQKFADYINKYTLPLTNGHQKGGAIDDDLGVLNFAEVITEDDTASLFVRGELDTDNPLSEMLIKKTAKGKQYAFSIEGIQAITKPSYSEKLGRMIDEFVDAIPKAVTITTKPSYIPSFLEVLQKSYDLNFYKSNEMANEQKETVKTTEEVAETNNTEETTPEVESEETTEATKSEDSETTEEVSESDAKETTEPTEEVEEDLEKAYDKRKQGKDMMKSISDRLEKMDGRISKIEKSIGSKMDKSFEEVHNVLKSFHADVEALKDMPLQKKSKVVNKSYEEAKEQKPKTLNEGIASYLN